MISAKDRLPEGFREQMKQLLGEDYDRFHEAMNHAPETSIKINIRKSGINIGKLGFNISKSTDTPNEYPYKSSRSNDIPNKFSSVSNESTYISSRSNDTVNEPNGISEKPTDILGIGYENLQPVKWCRSGFYLSERPLFTANPLLHAGVFYVQDASSMIYEEVLHRIMPMVLDTSSAPRVLDMCAAPGGKTTSLINALPDNSFVVANEYVSSRASILKENLIKWGYPHFAITNSPTKDIALMDSQFDLVAVDAPCSGEGMMRKDDIAVEQWNTGLQNQCASLQREILRDAFKALKPGGFLIYSTCTFNRLEDEENAKFIVDELNMVPLDLDFPDEWGIGRGINTDIPCYRFMPHITRGEGLFLAVFRKEGDYPHTSITSKDNFIKQLKSKTKIVCIGIPQIIEKGKLSIPASESVLATDYNPTLYPTVELQLEEAQSYLRHEALRFPEGIPTGYLTVTYKGHPLGLVKNIGSRANNLYPSNWKIRMQLQ